MVKARMRTKTSIHSSTELQYRILKNAIQKNEEKLKRIEQPNDKENDIDHKSEKGAWLIEAIDFNHGFQLGTSEAKRIALDLFNSLTKEKSFYKKEAKFRDFEILIANLIFIGRLHSIDGDEHRTIEQPIKIFRTPNKYIKNRYIVASSFVIELIDYLESANLIEQAKGFYTNEKSMMTRIWPTIELLRMFKGTNPQCIDYRPVELIVLRNENKKDMDYIDTDETIRIRRILDRANRVNRGAIISLNRNKRLHTDLHAIFHNGRFDHGGRLYTCINGYQWISKEMRSRIRINNEPSIELDFSGFHPRLLYALEGIQYNEDPYTEASDDPALRPLLKELLFMLLYSKNETKALAAGNCSLRFRRDYLELLKGHRLTIKDLIKMMKDAHAPIAMHFSSQACFNLMNLDSKIALNIIEHFTNSNIPILAIHDSFIVMAKFKDELRDVMDEAYRKYSGGFTCPIS